MVHDPASAYIPRKYRAPNSPQGLVPLRAEGFIEVSGPSDRGKPKPGVRGVVAAMQLGLPIENIDVDHKSVSDIIDIAFAGYYKLRFIPMGWADLGYERDADDLALRWLNGREPQLIAMC